MGSQETVNFLQPSATAIAVNRISGSNGSEILGHINANGDVGLLDDVAALGRVDIVKHGRLVAVVLSPRAFDSTLAPGIGAFAINYLSYLEAWWMKSVRHEEDEPVLISRVQRIWIHGPLDPNTPIATYIRSEYGWLLRSTPV